MRLKDKVAVITGASAGFGMSRGFLRDLPVKVQI